VEKMPAALVFLMAYPAAQSCAGLTLHLAAAKPRWSGGNVSHAQVLAQLRCEVEIGRSRLRKPVQSVRPRFVAASRNTYDNHRDTEARRESLFAADLRR
jgi:hypothetical protein